MKRNRSTLSAGRTALIVASLGIADFAAAHGLHVGMPSESSALSGDALSATLLHLLAHSWPVLIAAIALIGVAAISKLRDQQ